MTDKCSKLPAHLRPPYEKPKKGRPVYRDETGDKATGRADKGGKHD